MKKFFLLPVIHFILINVNAQVKIGAPGNPDVNAVLELAGTTKGLLLPRLALTGTTSPAPLSAFTAGMVVYNTSNASDVLPGYYFSDGVKWIRISTALETWSLSGNLATNPVNQFLGTSDSTNLSIRTNNLERIRITGSGTVEIGTTTSVFNARLKVGGTLNGEFSNLVLLQGTINPTGNGILISLRNSPSFGTGFNPMEAIGIYTQFIYSGNSTGRVIGEVADISTAGPSSQNLIAGVYGSVTRSSSGTADGSYFGGSFRSQVSSVNSGGVNEVVAIFGNAHLSGSGSVAIGNVGGLQNSITTLNPNHSISIMYGVKNQITHSVASAVPNVYGVQNLIAANSGAIFTDCYGTYTNFQTNFGSIVRAYGHYLAPVTVATIGEYRGIFIGQIEPGGGTRRAFEYAGTGTNDPVIINYDGSVQIGTDIPVTNAKLSVVDGHLQSGQTTKPLIATTGSIGTGGTATLNDATDVAGFISLDLGSGAWGVGAIATVTFNKVYVTAPVVVITPMNANSAHAIANQRPYITTTTTSFTINFATAATTGVVLPFSYHVIETVNN